MPDIFALVDCNNFYTSCEKLFVPQLANNPVVVLSNNDGCVIARSSEAKSLGIGMGIPVFEIESLIRKHNVQVFSTNYSLYGNISGRVMQVLADHVNDMEIYSIDEAFLDLSFLPFEKLNAYAIGLKNAVHKSAGIPVSIGIAPTKILAKAANHLAKKNPEYNGIFNLYAHPSFDHLLKQIAVADLWGVGEKYQQFFRRNGIHTALDLKQSDPFFIRNHLGVIGQRLVMELNGKPCYLLDDNPNNKKEICTSRSFGHPITEYDELEEATMNYAAKVAEKLRSESSLAGSVLVFVMTNKFAKGPQYVNYQQTKLNVPSNQTTELIHHCSVLLRNLFRKGYRYKKSGIIVSELVPESGEQTALWKKSSSPRSHMLSKIIDRINNNTGKEMLRYAVQGNGESWKMRQHNLSPHYTTRWNEVLSVNIDNM